MFIIRFFLYKLHIINCWCYLSITFIFFYFWNYLEYMVNTLNDTFLLLPNTCRNYHVSLSHEFCNWKYCKHFSRDNFYLFVEFELNIDKINEVYRFVSKEIFLTGTERIQFSSFPHYYGSIKKQRRLFSERCYFTSYHCQILKTWLNQLILTNSLFLVYSTFSINNWYFYISKMHSPHLAVLAF